ncbi:MAG: O-antigen ligase family protein [Steroidobacteraceae bacterium]
MSFSAALFLGGFVVGCWMAFTRHPVYGLLTYVAALYIDPTGQWWGTLLQGVRWELVAAAVTLLAMYVHKVQFRSLAIFRSRAFWGFVVFTIWIVIQSSWALDPISHGQLVQTWVKFLIVCIMICGCIDSWNHFRMFLWMQVLGCFYLGWLAYTQYSGGRFEGFGTGSFGEANAGALELVIGLILAGSLFLAGTWRSRIALLAPIALIADGIVTTVSRSGFLAAAGALFVYNIFAPKGYRKRVAVLSVIGVLCFLSLTTTGYWNRMQTIEYEGADIPGIDTGGGRLDIIRAQWLMFKEHPFGCGHMCTSFLSPQFIAKQLLTGGERASHNTFMTMLVDQGIPGAVLYVALLMWTYRTLRVAARKGPTLGRFPVAALPALAAAMTAITIGDLFVQYPKLEVRVWFISLLIVYVELALKDTQTARDLPAQVPARTHSPAM